MNWSCDIAVVGGGAAGLAAAIFAAQSGAGRVVILDGAKSLGAKILVSGGGRCNVTHDCAGPDDYNGSRNIVRNVLAAFDVQATVKWFTSMGLEMKSEEGGKLFPVSDSARTVLAALVGRCGELKVDIQTRQRVRDVSRPRKEGENFQIVTEQGEWWARRVILATGGRSLPLSGSDGQGWEMARRLGHGVTATYPALVPLVLEESFFHAGLSGLSQVAELSTFVDGKRMDRRSGSLLWTHFGVSGPVVMDASRHWTSARGEGRNVEMRVNLLPGKEFEQVEQWLIFEAGERAGVSMSRILRQEFPQRVAEALLGHCRIESDLPAGQLSRELRRKLVHALTALVLPIVRDRGWNYAEVTAGGVPLTEIDYRTMQSRKTKGLYLVGEMLDCDGRIGGFNFQWAWATGYLAGSAK